jgi:hypothetical protein
MTRSVRTAGLLAVLCALGAGSVAAQVATGAITGVVRDPSGAALPGVTVLVGGERLIGGSQTQQTDTSGAYRFDLLPPGTYELRFQLPGFKAAEHKGIKINAAFTASLETRLEVGRLEESITVEGASPTVDTKSSLQQTVMSQEILEGVPTGRDVWSVAKIIPGVLVSTYDVGGTQSMQQSAMSAHGSLDVDKTFALDGLAVNWPGGGGGSTMLYYDQGMFEEVNYQTAAIPAEVQAGGIFMNMVTKDGGNRWRGNMRFYWANEDTQGDNSQGEELQRFAFPGGNPITRLYDFNVSAGGPLVKDKLWITGAFRDWSVDRLTLGARNPDGTPALDDNKIRNYSGKLAWQIAPGHKLTGSFNYDNKLRFHRRDPPPAFVEDRASLYQLNPAKSVLAKYTGVRDRVVLESSLGGMFGVTDYRYQEGTLPTDIRIEDAVRNTGSVAAPRKELLPNHRVQFDNVVSYRASGLGGEHLVKGGVQFAHLRLLDEFEVNGDMYLLFNDGVPNAIRIWNTPTSYLSLERMVGVFVQDSWSLKSGLTLNLGARFDTNKGWIPAQSNPAGTFVEARSVERRDVIDQKIGSWRTGLVYDVGRKGKTALKASWSRYAQQVGIDRVQNVHPFQFTSGTRSWNDVNGDRLPQPNELGTFSGFPGQSTRYADADGPAWPYSDEITAGVEHQLFSDLRVSLMYYHRTNRKQVGLRNVAVPGSAYTAQTVGVPGAPTGPGGTVTFYNLNPTFQGRQDNVRDNDDALDTDYNGVELILAKRFSGRWQMLAGLTVGENVGAAVGGDNPQRIGDLNDPNNALNFPGGVVGPDSKFALRLSGSYRMPGDVTFAGSLISNGGYAYQSTFAVTRAVFPTLTRASQTVRLSERGAERFPNVTMVDLRLSRPFRFGQRSITPQIDLFNATNASAIVNLTPAVGSRYLFPSEIVAPRMLRVGLSMDF